MYNKSRYIFKNSLKYHARKKVLKNFSFLHKQESNK
jgi:hypothetical protein